MSGPVGRTLKRRRKRGDDFDEVYVAGRVNDVFVCVPARVFASPYTVPGAQLATEYNIKAADLAASESEPDRLRRLDHDATSRAQSYFGRGRVASTPEPAADSPEGQFQALEAAAAQAAADQETADADRD